jgi:hypothetical protein
MPLRDVAMQATMQGMVQPLICPAIQRDLKTPGAHKTFDGKRKISKLSIIVKPKTK